MAPGAVAVASRGVTADRDAALERINGALAGVDLAAPSTTKYGQLETALAALAQLQASQVVAATISKAANFTVRVVQSKRAQAAKLFVGVVTDPQEFDATCRAARRTVETGPTPGVLLLVRSPGESWSAPWGVETNTPGPSPLRRLSDTLQVHVDHVESPVTLPDQPRVSSPGFRPLAAVPTSTLVLDPRVRRMLRTAVASRPAVMLVGPPGTGKSQLVAELFAEIAADPSVVGMTEPHEPFVTTPDESWTVRELVGGDTVDDHGRIRFTPGAVLQAIAQDRWLVLDEANRADMDRIFGGLLTWLSGQSVNVGRVSNAPDASPVRLGWTDSPHSQTAGLESLIAELGSDETVDYLAGSEWRLLGTYNALDAQRVFRFGLALGRRFAHVPVPPPSIDGFTTALESRIGAVDEARRAETRTRIAGIYEAHLGVEAAALGPAVFFEIPGYVAAGGQHSPLEELLAEAYLTSTGTWLARLEDDQLDTLGLMLSSPTRLGSQWDWVRSQLHSFR